MAATTEEFKKALETLQEAVVFAQTNKSEVLTFKIARDACIQRFKFCVEIAWKVSAKFMGSSASTTKVVVREMAQVGLISDTEVWFSFVEARNRSSHTYNEDQAVLVFNVIPQFLVESSALLEKLKK